MKTKKLYFESTDPAFPGITSIKTHIPDWYKDMKKFNGGKPQFYPHKTVGIKECAPFLDALTLGYSIPLASDMLVEQIDEEPRLTWLTADTKNLVTLRKNHENEKIPVPPGFSLTKFSWETRVAIDIPAGYSIIVTQPFNRADLPFHTLTGVVDGPMILAPGSLSFYLREGFEGLIPEGTPIAQVIPFRREDWKSEVKSGLVDKAMIQKNKSVSRLLGWYKQNVWQKKSYN